MKNDTNIILLLHDLSTLWITITMKQYKKWSQEELDCIASSHSNLKDKELAQLLSEKTGHSVTVNMVRRQRRKLSLSKPRGRPSKNNKLNIEQQK